ncbi:MAG: diguanylate cyclase [Bdellovibrionaceae bacterium]|nr:diguanylate cyclase [Pseudobdellovibrionaceae bacterium]
MSWNTLQTLWPKEFEFLIIHSYKDLLLACAHQPMALIIADTKLSHCAEPLQQIRTKFPDILRFVLTLNTEPQALYALYKESLIHRYFDGDSSPETLELQIQEALAMIFLVTEKNKFFELSITDPVTHLTNHRFFQQRIRQELHKAKIQKDSLSLLMIDVDHFKLLNDQHGHPMGDMVLAMIAAEIKKQIPANASASRYGGEEFAVLLPKCTAAKALALAEHLRIAVSKISSIDFRLSISIGIASFPEHGLDTDEIVSLADHALYCAKRQGRNMSIVAGDGTY